MHLPIIAIGTASILATAWGTTLCLPAWFVLDTYGDVIFGFLKTAGIVVAAIAALFVITKFILPRFHS